VQINAITETTVTVTSDWTRVATASATITNPTVLIKLATSGDAIDVALFQNELGAFITSPIPTVASQVTRAADQISILTSAFPYSATAGTMVANGEWANGSAINPNAATFASLDDGTGNERVMLYNIGGNGGMAITDGGSVVASYNSAVGVAAGVFATLAVAYKLDDSVGAAGGTVGATDTSCTMPTVTKLNIGNTRGNIGLLNGHIKRLDYYAVRKSNAELVVLST